MIKKKLKILLPLLACWFRRRDSLCLFLDLLTGDSEGNLLLFSWPSILVEVCLFCGIILSQSGSKRSTCHKRYSTRHDRRQIWLLSPLQEVCFFSHNEKWQHITKNYLHIVWMARIKGDIFQFLWFWIGSFEFGTLSVLLRIQFWAVSGLVRKDSVSLEQVAANLYFQEEQLGGRDYNNVTSFLLIGCRQS